jgi:hypothetical protein
MYGRGYLFAITDDALEEFLGKRSADARERWIGGLLEAWDPAYAAEVDKAWPAIHRCLSTAAHGEPPEQALRTVLLGGIAVSASASRVASIVGREAVPKVAEALARILEPELRQRFYDSLDHDAEAESEELEFLYTWQWFERVRDLYRRAAGEGRAVLFTVREPADERATPGSRWSFGAAAAPCGRENG